MKTTPAGPVIETPPAEVIRQPRRRWWRIVPYAVTLIALAVLLRQANWTLLWQTLRQVDPLWFALGIGGFIINLFIQTYRWSICLEDRGRVPFFRLFRLILTSFFFNNFGLGFLGGDVYRTARITREHGLKRSAFSVLLARVTNIWGAAVLPATFAFLAWGLFQQNRVFMLVFWLSVVSWPLTLVFLMYPYYRDTLSRILRRFGRERLAVAVQTTILDARNLWLLFISSLAFQIVAVVVHVLFARALGIDIGWRGFLIIAPCVMLLTSLPISVNGVGVREACYVIGFSFFGVIKAEALAFAVLTYSGHFLYSIIGGLLLLTERWSRSEQEKGLE